jgi:hypothetical protein
MPFTAESVLGPSIKNLYDTVRRNTIWFMRKEMVQDCSGRGGCCSRMLRTEISIKTERQRSLHFGMLVLYQLLGI